ncbi:MAG: DciA family protein [Pseudomonadota bacterium]|nr:DciA family protein [Pseudomonadota bacterium]
MKPVTPAVRPRRAGRPLRRFQPAPHSPLFELYERAGAWERKSRALQESLRLILPTPVGFGGLQGGVLTLHCQSSADLTRARFMNSQLLGALQQEPGWRQVRQIRWRIRPPEPPARKLPEARRSLSTESCALLASLADASPKQPRLAVALRRLSSATAGQVKP